jgi:hypothetical protein
LVLKFPWKNHSQPGHSNPALFATSIQAVFIGVGFYTDQRLKALRACPGEIADLAQAAQSSSGARIPPENCDVRTTPSETTKSELVAAIAARAQRAGPDDIFYLHFGGHGIDVGASFVLATSDVDLDRPLETALTAQELAGILAKCRARGIFVVADCCGGAAIAEKTPQLMADVGESHEFRILLSSSRVGQSSWEVDGVGSVFHHAYKEALLGKMPGTGKQGEIYFDELFDWVRSSLEKQFSEIYTNLPVQQPCFYGIHFRDPLLFVLADISLAAIDLQTARYTKAELRKSRNTLLTSIFIALGIVVCGYWLWMDQHRYWVRENETAVLYHGYPNMQGFGLPRTVWRSTIDTSILSLGSDPVVFSKDSDPNAVLHRHFSEWHPSSELEMQVYSSAAAPDKEAALPRQSDRQNLNHLLESISSAGRKEVAIAILRSPRLFTDKSTERDLLQMAGDSYQKEWVKREKARIVDDNDDLSAAKNADDEVFVAEYFSCNERGERTGKGGSIAITLSSCRPPRYPRPDAFSEWVRDFRSGRTVMQSRVNEIIQTAKRSGFDETSAENLVKLMSLSGVRPCENIKIRGGESYVAKVAIAFLRANCDSSRAGIWNDNEAPAQPTLKIGWSEPKNLRKGKFREYDITLPNNSANLALQMLATQITRRGSDFPSEESLAYLLASHSTNLKYGLTVACNLGVGFERAEEMMLGEPVPADAKPLAWLMLWARDDMTGSRLLLDVFDDTQVRFPAEILLDAGAVDQSMLDFAMASPAMSSASRAEISALFSKPRQVVRLLLDPDAKIRSAAGKYIALRDDLADIIPLYNEEASRQLGPNVPWDMLDLAALLQVKNTLFADLASVPPEAAELEAESIIRTHPEWSLGLISAVARRAQQIRPRTIQETEAVERWTAQRNISVTRQETLCRLMQNDGRIPLGKCLGTKPFKNLQTSRKAAENPLAHCSYGLDGSDRFIWPKE